MNIDLLKKLTEAHGVPGREDAIRVIVREELGDICDITADAMGSLHCVKKGSGGKSAKRLMLAAHMDEIGFLVKHVDSNGFCKIQPLGGWDPRQMFSQRVIVHGQYGPLNGLLIFATKPKHLLTEAEQSKKPEIDGFYIDLGLSGEEAKKKVHIGAPVTMDRGFQAIGDLFTCKAMDDRVGLYVMIEAVKAVHEHDVDIYAVATVQEEIGLRGAAASGSAINPDIVVALDVTIANDTPGVPEGDVITKLGSGAAIKILDSSLICHPKVVDHFVAVAVREGIDHQMEMLPLGGTDAGGIQRLHGGIPAFTLSIPTRYLHTVNETVKGSDVDACVNLLARYIEDAHNGDYSY